MNRNVSVVPPNLPIPVDDGACDHLPGALLPSIELAATSGRSVDLAAIPGTVVLYCYPRTGRPDQALPAGWDQIPGARGCTPQSCSFRDHQDELLALGARVFGLSSQTTEYQQEAVARLHLPFELLSDASLDFARALKLPLLEVDDMVLIKRVTLIVEDGRIAKVFYPVFPPDRNVDDVLAWLRDRRQAS